MPVREPGREFMLMDGGTGGRSGSDRDGSNHFDQSSNRGDGDA